MNLLKLFCTLLTIALAAQASPAAEPRYNIPIQKLMNARKYGKNAKIGISIVDVQSGETLCDINAGSALVPASNMKLLTTGAALVLLGDKHNFTTAVYSTGEVTGGTLHGHLVVVADGDPAISGREHGGKSTAVFDAWAAEIAKTIKVVRGDLIIDDNVFDRQYLHPSWPENQLVRWYCAPVSAFALNDNCIDVTIRAATAGSAAAVIVDPPTKYFEIRNSASTVAAGAKNTAVVNRLIGRDVLVISGNISEKAGESATPVAVADPAAFAGTVLRERLEKAGVTVQGKILLLNQPSDTAKMQRLTGTSHSLVTVITTANKRSQNFYAEMLLKTIGRKEACKGSFAAGSKAMTKVLAGAGVRGTFTIDDGSGMSRNNKVSPEQFTTFLRYMANTKYAGAYINSLAISGEQEASLHKRLANAPYEGKVYAKTGHIAGVSALSGYVKSGGRTYAFSVIANGSGLDSNAARNLQDGICKFLVDLK